MIATPAALILPSSASTSALASAEMLASAEISTLPSLKATLAIPPRVLASMLYLAWIAVNSSPSAAASRSGCETQSTCAVICLGRSLSSSKGFS